ncbi:hypothetical protein FHS85_001227 [Rhodoligotrophos appendicifer]|uniref:hypothetical protein n=1 Tax=Rhodoligotrophos appendicifer TaxID=987056 RepID=UPI0011851054|nr:hypothetical protein [Rhodoligotrophos appendicifer]
MTFPLVGRYFARGRLWGVIGFATVARKKYPKKFAGETQGGKRGGETMTKFLMPLRVKVLLAVAPR